jgi:starvation-inducible DNA-binding protein
MADTNEMLQRLMEIQARMTAEKTPSESSTQDSADAEDTEGNSVELARALGKFLANTYSVYHEAHGFHWNVKGPDFFQYHSLFSGIYEDLSGSVDDIAENILRLGYDSPFRQSELMAMVDNPESKIGFDDTPQAMTVALLKRISALEEEAEELFTLADDADEQGVANFVAERIDSLQKTQWQLRASAGMQKPMQASK